VREQPRMRRLERTQLGTCFVPAGSSTTTTASDKKNMIPRSRTSAAGGLNDSFPPKAVCWFMKMGRKFSACSDAGPGRGGCECDKCKRRPGNGSEVRRASSVEPAGVLELSPEVAEGSLLYRVEPEYPRRPGRGRCKDRWCWIAHGARWSGAAVNLVSGQAVLADAAIVAVKQWRFNRAWSKAAGGDADKVTLNFRLQR